MIDTLFHYAMRWAAGIALVIATVNQFVGQPLWGTAWLGVSLGFMANTPKKSKPRPDEGGDNGSVRQSSQTRRGTSAP